MVHNGRMARTINQAVHTQVAILAGKGLSGRQVAKTLDISPKTVRRALQRQAQTIDAAEQALRNYQVTVTEVVPETARAERLRQIIADTEEPMASMRAIEHIDKVMGYLRPASDSPSQMRPASLFELPTGATIGILVKPKD